ncbi:MAG: rhomboid family intramembrane serine protease [Acidobacteria bacterium]|nr:rhomboid family intramembrane serine protease [Acidobacteriota bacterium]
MPRYAPSGAAVQFGPGPITPAVRVLIIANVVVFLLTFVAPGPTVGFLGLTPEDVLGAGRVWQLATYLFVHSPYALSHILFNMLALWMFGVELERRWGTPAFTKYYFLTGVGAGVCTLLVSLLPFGWAARTYATTTIGASGAIYGLLMAWAMLFPHRQILFMFVFPLRARIFVLIIGALAFFSAIGASGSGVANLAHLGGLLVGWFYLQGPDELRAQLRYRVTRWRMERMRRRFNIHKGGRGRWEH